MDRRLKDDPFEGVVLSNRELTAAVNLTNSKLNTVKLGIGALVLAVVIASASFWWAWSDREAVAAALAAERRSVDYKQCLKFNSALDATVKVIHDEHNALLAAAAVNDETVDESNAGFVLFQKRHEENLAALLENKIPDCTELLQGDPKP